MPLLDQEEYRKLYPDLNSVKGKLRLWYGFFIKTMDRKKAAKDAKYQCKNDMGFSSIGNQNFFKLQHLINKHLDEIGIGEEMLKFYLADGIRGGKICKVTKFFQYQGRVVTRRTVTDRGLQQNYIITAIKVKGMLTEKIDVVDERSEKTDDETLRRLYNDPEAVKHMQELSKIKARLKQKSDE